MFIRELSVKKQHVRDTAGQISSLLLKVEIGAEDAVERHEELGVVGEDAGLALDGERVRHLLHHRVAEELHAVAVRRVAVLIEEVE